MYKKLAFGDDARLAMMHGVDAVAKAVVTTLGPRGRNVALSRKYQVPKVVHDGVSVAKEIYLKDPLEQIGAMLVREAADKTNDIAGDGTTTATLLAQQMAQAGMRNITAGSNPMMIRFGIEKATVLVIQELKKISKPIKSKEEIKQVATISSGYKEIGETIAEVIDKVGKDGIIQVERGSGTSIDVIYKEGMSLDRGYTSPFFSTDRERMEAEIDNPHILVTDEKLTSVHDVEEFFAMFLKNGGKDIVIIADEIEGEALAILVVNTVKQKVIKAIGIKSPGFGERRDEMLQDIAIVTGANLITKKAGRSMQEVTMEDLGIADKVWASKDETRIIGGKGNPNEIKSRINLIKKQIKESANEFDREKLEERLAKISGGVAQINVGASTEVEMKEKVERVRDAVEATQAATDEGIVPGGGVAFLKARAVLENFVLEDADEKIGVKIVYDALEQPTRWLIKNAGIDDGSVLNEIIKKNQEDFGFNVLTKEFGSMFEFGIIDPVKVSRSALEYGASVAMMILTTEALVAEEETDKSDEL